MPRGSEILKDEIIKVLDLKLKVRSRRGKKINFVVAFIILAAFLFTRRISFTLSSTGTIDLEEERKRTNHLLEEFLHSLRRTRRKRKWGRILSFKRISFTLSSTGTIGGEEETRRVRERNPII
ncbi:hypothetical protein JTE90_012772 [Oedothorax gibbosus]|uniref:Uncharacterized protein n=1 Tax=Oedothorax gibbosus TaxID=931172 RepID=A0AAV6W2G7_9ARAC|nr:hypothetical protein JTE90_012772 [Oedothorax gibbosus]